MSVVEWEGMRTCFLKKDIPVKELSRTPKWSNIHGNIILA